MWTSFKSNEQMLYFTFILDVYNVMGNTCVFFLLFYFIFWTRLTLLSEGALLYTNSLYHVEAKILKPIEGCVQKCGM